MCHSQSANRHCLARTSAHPGCSAKPWIGHPPCSPPANSHMVLPTHRRQIHTRHVRSGVLQHAVPLHLSATHQPTLMPAMFCQGFETHPGCSANHTGEVVTHAPTFANGHMVLPTHCRQIHAGHIPGSILQHAAPLLLPTAHQLPLHPEG
jgi:hypothetical protein